MPRKRLFSADAASPYASYEAMPDGAAMIARLRGDASFSTPTPLISLVALSACRVAAYTPRHAHIFAASIWLPLRQPLRRREL